MSTKNVKGDRKVVVERHVCTPRVWKIPDGLDLEDKSIVSNWYTEEEELFIKYVDGNEQTFECDQDATPYSEGAEIEDAGVGCRHGIMKLVVTRCKGFALRPEHP